MKANNIIKIPLSNYEGVTVEIDTANVSKKMVDSLVEAFKPERFKIWEMRLEQSYQIGTWCVITIPLKNIGYRAFADGDNLIFVNSKLPRAKRKEIARHFIQQANE